MDMRDTPAAGAYGVLYADPAWRFATHGPEELNLKGAEQHYPTMETSKLGLLPVNEVAGGDCWLFMWTTWPHLQQAFDLARAWGDPANPWRYRTGGCWAKRPRNWRGDPGKWQFGPGYLFRSTTEPLLVFGRGNVDWHATAERNLWIAPIREHSRKPDEVREMIDRVTPPGPRLEMFTREVRPGWDCWGNEVNKFKGGRNA